MIYKFHELRAAEMCGVTIESVFKPRRKEESVLARFLCMYFADIAIGTSQANNADRFGLSRYEVIHAKKTIDNRCESDKDFRELVDKYMYICREEKSRQYHIDTGVEMIKQHGMAAFIAEQNAVLIRFMHIMNQYIEDKATEQEVLDSASKAEAVISKIRFNFES